MPLLLSCPHALLLVAVWAPVLLAADLSAQAPPAVPPGTVVLLRTTFAADTLVDLSTVLWRFREGDDPSWADPALDDAGWALVDTDAQPDARAPDPWQGLGWFRLHLRVDSSLHDTLLGLQMYHAGASEIYLDGRRVGGFGIIGASAAADRPYVPLGLPLTIHLDGRGEHVLAVRYANRSLSPWALQTYNRALFRPAGFALVVGRSTDVVHGYVFEKSALYTEALIMGLLVAIVILHLLLYGFDRRDRANLYFGVAVAFLCIGHFCDHAMGYRVLLVDGAWSGALLQEIGNQTFVLFVLLLLAALYALFAPRLLRFLWGGLILWVGAGVLWYAFGTAASFPAFPVPGLLLLMEAVRVSGVAVYKRKEGAWILATAMLFTLGAVLFIYLVANASAPPDGRVVLQQAPHLINRSGYLGLLFFTPIPLGMSVLLARRFASRSRRLAQELVRVEALSAQTLAQERDKQALIASQNARLEAEVADRTAALRQSLADLKATQAQLIQQEKMASLGQLTAGIAHEIKNPLNFVNNFAALTRDLVEDLDEETDPDEIQALLADLKASAQKIEEHGQRADGIVRAMLDHSRSGSGERRAIDLNALVTEYVDLAYHGKRAQHPDFNATTEKDLDDAVGPVDVMPQGLGRVLLNLISNAFDAVHEQAVRTDASYAPTVRVTTQRRGSQVEIRVTDNGPGIPDELRAKIFEPFFTTKPTGSGTGLGLSLSYDIITQGHGGTLTVESEEGKGATFIVTLPLHYADASPSA